MLGTELRTAGHMSHFKFPLLCLILRPILSTCVCNATMFGFPSSLGLLFELLLLRVTSSADLDLLPRAIGDLCIIQTQRCRTASL